MPDRLSALDASFLYLEDVTTPMHVGGVSVFRNPKTGFDYDRLVHLIEQRISLVPHYRQKVVQVPGRLARPVWADDADFDITYHVRRSALPRPGNERQLHDLVARLMSRQLDHSRPLWEIYLVEGLADNQVAVITKTHQAMIDGTRAIDIGQVILDESPKPKPPIEDLWMPIPAPSPAQLVADAVSEMLRSPGELVENVQAVAADVTGAARKIGSVVGGIAAMASSAARPAPGSPLNDRISRHRRFAVVRSRLDDYRAVRRQHGGTINDVVLATVAGALRTWLLSRGEVVYTSSTVRALIPVSVRDDAARPGGAGGSESGTTLVPVGNAVRGYLLDLPIGEPNAVVRLHHVSHAMRAHAESGRSVGADAFVKLSGFAPPTLHALGARAASSFTQRIFNLVVTNVPGPQVPLYAAGAKMVEMFPVVPLARNQALSIGVTSYHGGVYCGLNADRDAMPDVEVLVGAMEESLEELVGTVCA